VKDYYLSEINKVFKQKWDDIHSGQSYIARNIQSRYEWHARSGYRKRMTLSYLPSRLVNALHQPPKSPAHIKTGQPAQLCFYLPLVEREKRKRRSFRYSHASCDLPSNC
jgi:hypothetical protein